MVALIKRTACINEAEWLDDVCTFRLVHHLPPCPWRITRTTSWITYSQMYKHKLLLDTPMKATTWYKAIGPGGAISNLHPIIQHTFFTSQDDSLILLSDDGMRKRLFNILEMFVVQWRRWKTLRTEDWGGGDWWNRDFSLLLCTLGLNRRHWTRGQWPHRLACWIVTNKIYSQFGL